MGDKGTVWLPEDASTLAPAVDSLFYFVLWVSVILFVGVVAAMVYFAFKYRRRDPHMVPVPVKESKILEISWVIIPAILVLLVFNWGFRLYVELGVPPPNSYEIRVTAKQWLWEFEYPNGTKTTNELHVPVDRPVKLVMSSTDVIHSMFIPVFRVKHDVLPNRYSAVWFEATKMGEYTAFCTEYCGTQHSGMLASVVVHRQDDFENWLETAGGSGEDMPLPEYGQVLYQQQACFTCHSIDGSDKVGPTFQGLFGRSEQLQGGGSVQVDENYLRESILEPNAKIVAGYQPVMPPYASLNERQVSALIEFIKQQ